MAVRLDRGVLVDLVDPVVLTQADGLLAADRIGDLTGSGGGVTAVVQDQTPTEVWVGVVAGQLSAECDCAGRILDGAGLCAHAVALTLRALDADVAWSSAATPPSAGSGDPRVVALVEAAASLPPRTLAWLVAGHAATDRRLETALLVAAGRLGPATPKELATLRRAVAAMAQDATAGEFDLHHVARACESIADELEVLAEREPSPQALDLVEYAAGVVDGLSGHLFDAWETYEGEPERIGARIRAVHLNLCRRLDADPDHLATRLAKVIGEVEFTSCLDSPEEYLPLLGRDRLDTLRRR